MPEAGRKGRDASQVSSLEAHLGFWLRFVSNHVSERFRQQVEAKGVSVSEWVALRRLYAGDASSTELVEALGMTKGAISKLVARLEHKGLLERTEVAQDRRAQQLELTDAGRKLVPQLAHIADENDALFFGHLSSSERHELRQSLMGIVRLHQLRDVPVD
jgi:DNA-binding MarR family transcriptional regulator